jgi:hypothetical protein
MTVLSGAFAAGMKAFRDLKALGDLNERLRAAATLLTGDLAADHFDGHRRLSDSTFWSAGPPREGYFRLWQLQLPADQGGLADEGADLDGNRSFRALNNCLAFTVKRHGNGLQDFLAGKVPAGSPLLTLPLADSRYQDGGGQYKSQWAEVAWFVKPTGASAGGSRLYGLYRRQLVVVPDAQLLNWPPAGPVRGSAGDYPELSCAQQGPHVYFNSPRDLTVPQRRFGMDPRKPGGVPTEPDGTYPVLRGPDGAPTQADLVLTDVLSFDFRLLLTKPVANPTSQVPLAYVRDFYDLGSLGAASLLNPGRYRLAGGTQALVFDSWTDADDGTYDYTDWSTSYTTTPPPRVTPTTVPLRKLFYTYMSGGRAYSGWYGDVQVQAVKVSIRAWDARTEQARQITIIQDL